MQVTARVFKLEIHRFHSGQKIAFIRHVFLNHPRHDGIFDPFPEFQKLEAIETCHVVQYLHQRVFFFKKRVTDLFRKIGFYIMNYIREQPTNLNVLKYILFFVTLVQFTGIF